MVIQIVDSVIGTRIARESHLPSAIYGFSHHFFFSVQDIVIHVCDVSHPDHKAQAETVTKTLKSLNLSADMLDNILVVGNKVDLLPENTPTEEFNCNVLVSSVTNQGKSVLMTDVTHCSRVQLKCDGTQWRTGGEVKVNGVGSQHLSHYLGTRCIQHYYR